MPNNPESLVPLGRDNTGAAIKFAIPGVVEPIYGKLIGKELAARRIAKAKEDALKEKPLEDPFKQYANLSVDWEEEVTDFEKKKQDIRDRHLAEVDAGTITPAKVSKYRGEMAALVGEAAMIKDQHQTKEKMFATIVGDVNGEYDYEKSLNKIQAYSSPNRYVKENINSPDLEKQLLAQQIESELKDASVGGNQVLWRLKYGKNQELALKDLIVSTEIPIEYKQRTTIVDMAGSYYDPQTGMQVSGSFRGNTEENRREVARAYYREGVSFDNTGKKSKRISDQVNEDYIKAIKLDPTIQTKYAKYRTLAKQAEEKFVDEHQSQLTVFERSGSSNKVGSGKKVPVTASTSVETTDKNISGINVKTKNVYTYDIDDALPISGKVWNVNDKKFEYVNNLGVGKPIVTETFLSIDGIKLSKPVIASTYLVSDGSGGLNQKIVLYEGASKQSLDPYFADSGIPTPDQFQSQISSVQKVVKNVATGSGKTNKKTGYDWRNK